MQPIGNFISTGLSLETDHLGRDFLVLDALVPLAFKLVLDLPGKVGLAAETVGDSVAGNLELGLAVDALAGAGQTLAVHLIKAKHFLPCSCGILVH